MRKWTEVWLLAGWCLMGLMPFALTGCGEGGGVGIAAAAAPPPMEVITMFNELKAKIDQLVQNNNHTLRWDKNYPSDSRFEVLAAFSNQAVLDKNTGLVWEQAPDTTTRSWASATVNCVNKTDGGTRGWRLPSVAELASLIDPSLAAPFVPASVFTGVQSAGYWSASTNAVDPTAAWHVDFGNGIVSLVFKTGFVRYAWCVRGPMQESSY